VIESALVVLYGLKWLTIAAKACIILAAILLAALLLRWWGR
jgi:hypothetical protein